MSYVGFCPPGVVLPYAGSVAPQGWLLCNGTTISRTTYSALFAAISTTYGTGDGSTTFALPDFRGVYPRGSDTNGTANYGGVTGHTPAGGSLGSKGGQKTAKNGLSASSGNQSADHSHGIGGDGSHDHSTNTGWQVYGGSGGTGITFGGSYVGPNQYNPRTDSAGSHSHGGGTGGMSVSHNHTVTIGAGDTETTPAFLAVNYIIKI